VAFGNNYLLLPERGGNTIEGMIFVPDITGAPDPVHVIVDQIAAAPGPTVWQTTLISAGVGAVLGMITGTMMEIVKPRVARFLLKREIKPLLIAEIQGNMRWAESLDRLDCASDPKGGLEEAERLLDLIDDQRFAHYLEMDSLAIYELDKEKSLQTFYKDAKTVLPLHIKWALRTGGEDLEGTAILISASLSLLKFYAEKFLKSQCP
jgi:hypothetical protein